MLIVPLRNRARKAVSLRGQGLDHYHPVRL